LSPGYDGDRALTPEEDFLWQVARLWRDPVAVVPPPNLNWAIVVDTAVANRLQILLREVLRSRGWLDQLPDEPAAALERGVRKHEALARLMAPDLTQYLAGAAGIDQEVIVLKGLWLSRQIYGFESARPGADIDVLLRRKDIPDCLTILEQEMGYGRWWRPLLDDRFYERHHLHQQRCNHDRSIWFEPHWRLDHPYTRLTVDCEALMDRTTATELYGQSVREMNPADLLISLAVHLVKHAVYLPIVLDRQDLPRLILADGMLIYFVDIAEAIGHYGRQIDWTLVVELARQDGAADILGSTLRVGHDYLAADVPAWVLEALLPPSDRDPGQTQIGRVTRGLMSRLAQYKVDLYLGRRPSPVWRFLLGYNEAIVFRPIRLLDLFHYLIPGRDYLQRRYGRATAPTAIGHFIRAVGQYVRVGVDTVRFNWQRRREVKRLDRQGYHWPGPPPALGLDEPGTLASADPP
jgi:hypothetical protein